MKDMNTTMQRLRDYADLTSITDGLSRATFELDALERTARRDTQALQTARLVVLLDGCRRAAKRIPKAQADSPQARFALAELPRLQAEVDQRVKKLVMAGGAVGINTLGIQRWAEQTVQAADAKRPAARRTAPKPRPAARPQAKATPAPARRTKASRAGNCAGCGKHADYIGQPSGLCNPCMDKIVRAPHW